MATRPDSPAAAPRPGPIVAAVAALAFLILLAYGLVRSPVDSLFLEEHGSRSLPLLWAGLAVVIAVVVSIYNRYAARVPLSRVLVGVATTSGLALAVLAPLAERRAPGAAVALYLWKDVHVVVLVEILWTFANATLKLRAARWVYGLFCAAGSIGGITGNLVAGELATRFGTASSLWAPLPVFAIVAAIGAVAGRLLAAPAPARGPAERRASGLRLLRESRYVALLFALIVTVQIVLTLLDFAYNAVLEASYPDTDLRTHANSRVYAAIDLGSLGLQLAAGPILALAGLGRVLLAIPLILVAGIASFLSAPGMAAVAALKVASKAFDYSLFRAGKELLYLPLGYREKTQGKALVDMFGYRVAKGGASVAIVGVGATAAAAVGAALGLVAVWLGLTWALLGRYRRRRAASQAEDDR